MEKKTGRTTGWVGYTLAWSWRRFLRRHNLIVAVAIGSEPVLCPSIPGPTAGSTSRPSAGLGVSLFGRGWSYGSCIPNVVVLHPAPTTLPQGRSKRALGAGLLLGSMLCSESSWKRKPAAPPAGWATPWLGAGGASCAATT